MFSKCFTNYCKPAFILNDFISTTKVPMILFLAATLFCDWCFFHTVKKIFINQDNQRLICAKLTLQQWDSRKSHQIFSNSNECSFSISTVCYTHVCKILIWQQQLTFYATLTNTSFSTFVKLGSFYYRMMPGFFIIYITCYYGLLHSFMSYMYMYVSLHVTSLIKQLSFDIHVHNTILQPPTFSCCSLIKLNRYSKLLGVTPLKSCWKFSTSSDGPTVWMYDYRLMYTQTRSVTEMLIW